MCLFYLPPNEIQALEARKLVANTIYVDKIISDIYYENEEEEKIEDLTKLEN